MAERLFGAGVRRVLVLLALAAAGVLVGRLAVLLLDERAASVSAPRAAAEASVAAPGSGRSARQAARMLRAWDADRAAAYARGDPVALRRLYVPRSIAALRDVRDLREYVDRGLVVRGLRMQVLTLRVLDSAPGRMRLEITDRRVGGLAVGGGVRAALPRDAPSTRRLVLRSRAGEWRVASVQDR